MQEGVVSQATSDPPWLSLPAEVTVVLRPVVKEIVEAIIEGIPRDVPVYAMPMEGRFGQGVRQGVTIALNRFLDLPGTRLPALSEDGKWVYESLGRGEVRSGRSLESLLAAYRYGARVTFRAISRTVNVSQMPPDALLALGESLFAYIDELSAASVAGHTDELTTSGRVRDRYRERLGQRLLAGAGTDVLTAAAARAEWTPPTSLTAVLLPAAEARRALATLSADTLVVGEDLVGIDDVDPDHPLTLLLVPDADGPGRRHLLRALAGRHAVCGPARPWVDARSSFDRAARTLALRRVSRSDDAIDSERHLADLVLAADPEALADLRAQVLDPLADLPAATRDRLAETLLSWLLHQGRRDEVAAELHVHAQTVRYRMGQVRELFGDGLADPAVVRELVVALSAPRRAER
jgi:hypothetical protein